MALFIPVGEPYRELLLIVEALVVVLSIQIGILYVKKFLKNKNNYTILAWGELLIVYSTVFALFITADFFTDMGLPRETVLNVAYLISIIGMGLFSYNTEREIKYEKHFISMILLGFAVLLFINIFIPIIEGTYITIICWLIFIIIVIIYIKKFTSRLNEKWRINVYSLIFGTIFIIIGFAGIADISVEFFNGFWIRFLGDFLLIFGILLVSVLFIGVPSLSEFDWFQKLRILNIIHNSGVSIASYNFTQKVEEKGIGDKILIAGGLVSISQVISELIKSDKHLDLVDHGDIKLLFEYGDYLINVLIVDEVLEVLRSKLKKFTNFIEDLYEDNLRSWRGNIRQFSLLDLIVEANFGPYERDREGKKI